MEVFQIFKIEEKALKECKKRNSNFIVSILTTTCGGWVGGSKEVQNLSIEISNKVPNEKNFILLEYNGVKAYISKSLKLKEDILIYQKLRIPFIGPIYGSKGILI